jgi:hypothetical protein
MDSVTEQNMGGVEKSLPSIEENSSQQWEENGVHWNRNEQGQLSYYDAASEAWVPYQE